jgi:protein ImuB
MSRIACLLIPDLPLAAVLRVEPDLRGQAVAVTRGEGTRAIAISASDEARAAGVKPGATVTQVRAICPGAILRPASCQAERTALDALLDAAWSISPRVEATRSDCVYVDVDGLTLLYPNEREVAGALWRSAAAVGLRVHVAVAPGKETARAIALAREGITVVVAGTEREALAMLPIEVLEPAAPLLEHFRRMGLRRVADLSTLPSDRAAIRLGREVTTLCAIATGVHPGSLFVPAARPEAVGEAVELDYSIERLEPLAFLLRPLFERMLARLAARALACGSYELLLSLDPRGRDERSIPLLGPTRDPAVLLTLARASLERSPPQAPVRGLAVRTIPIPLRPEQLSLLAPPGPAPARLAATLARLQALVGGDHVGAPLVPNSHDPDAIAMSAFTPPPPPVMSGVMSGTSGMAGAQLPLRPLAMAAFRPPRRLEVLFVGREMAYLRSDFVSGRVVSLAGPERIRASFTGTGTGAGTGAGTRDYYDVEIHGGALYRIYQDLGTGDFYADGVYD